MKIVYSGKDERLEVAIWMKGIGTLRSVGKFFHDSLATAPREIMAQACKLGHTNVNVSPWLVHFP
jgi:hypothetical protein